MLINHWRSASAASGLITSIKASISILAPSSQPAVVRRDGQKHHPNDQNEPSLTIAPRNGKSFSIFLERVQWNVVRLLTDALATVRIRLVNFCLWGSLSNHRGSLAALFFHARRNWDSLSEEINNYSQARKSKPCNHVPECFVSSFGSYCCWRALLINGGWVSWL